MWKMQQIWTLQPKFSLTHKTSQSNLVYLEMMKKDEYQNVTDKYLSMDTSVQEEINYFVPWNTCFKIKFY